MNTEVVAANQSASSTDLIHPFQPASEASKNSHTLHDQSPGSHSHPVISNSPTTSQWSLPSLPDPRFGAPSKWLKPVTPPMKFSFFSESPPKSTVPNLITYLPLQPYSTCIILTALVSSFYRRLFATLQLVSSVNCCTCRFIIDVFVGRDVFPIVLLCHLNSSPLGFSV